RNHHGDGLQQSGRDRAEAVEVRVRGGDDGVARAGAGRNRRVADDSNEYAGPGGAGDGAAKPVPAATVQLPVAGGDARLAGAGQLSRARRALAGGAADDVV